MPFQPGQSGNPSGRIPGSKNKKSQVAFEELLQLYCDNIPKLKTELEKLEGKDFVSEMRGLSEFIIPKQQRVVSTNFNYEGEEPVKEYFKIGGQLLEF